MPFHDEQEAWCLGRSMLKYQSHNRSRIKCSSFGEWEGRQGRTEREERERRGQSRTLRETKRGRGKRQEREKGQIERIERKTGRETETETEDKMVLL